MYVLKYITMISQCGPSNQITTEKLPINVIQHECLNLLIVYVYLYIIFISQRVNCSPIGCMESAHVIAK